MTIVLSKRRVCARCLLSVTHRGAESAFMHRCPHGRSCAPKDEPYRGPRIPACPECFEATQAKFQD